MYAILIFIETNEYDKYNNFQLFIWICIYNAAYVYVTNLIITYKFNLNRMRWLNTKRHELSFRPNTNQLVLIVLIKNIHKY